MLQVVSYFRLVGWSTISFGNALILHLFFSDSGILLIFSKTLIVRCRQF